MTRCPSNGPRCISICSISHSAATVKVASEKHHGKARRTPEREEGGGSQSSLHDPQEPSPRACAHAFVN
ncbi:solute carrier family 2, facilitated glucose transporter member 3a [Lates japonicus]|uniref:Solute carrier family 2, facilitated glucose transporter member 3a n=1 Tax=Lates japonicus TaxID=270547 RepID=A0AAD3R8X6_LATJO|nr:solute carrier family 2, facilitated glucose transporter member 3a [Lates japonicus]